MKRFALIAVILCLTGCSSKFAYNNLDWLIYWYMDDYVELSDGQESLFDEHMEHWMTWHRSEELVKYKQQLVELKADLQKGQLSQSQLSSHISQAQQHWHRVRDYLSPDLAVLAVKLNDGQVESLFSELEEENQEAENEFAQRMEKSPEERLTLQAKEMQENIKDYVGKLTPVQEAIIDKYVPRFASTFGDWITYRREIQAAARGVIDARHNTDDAVTIAQLTDIMTHPDRYRSPIYQQNRKHNNVVYVEMLMELGKTLSDKQKRKLNDKIDDMIEDVEDLMDAD